MKTFSRRDVLKTSLLVPAAAATAHAMGPLDAGVHAAGEVSGPLSAPASVAFIQRPAGGRRTASTRFRMELSPWQCRRPG